MFCWISVISFNFCVTLLWLFIHHILKNFWKSWHWNLGISFYTVKFYFSLNFFFEKLIFDTSIILLQFLLSLDLPFIHPETSTDVLEKTLNFWSNCSLAFQKSSRENLGNFPVKHSFLDSLIQFYFKRFMSVIDVQKTNMPKKF